MPSKPEIETIITTYLVDELNVLEADEVDTQANLFTEGILDSVGIMRLIAHIEQSLDFKIPQSDLIPTNFMTIDAMTHYLQAKFSDTPTT